MLILVYILFMLPVVKDQQVLITREGILVTFWYDSSSKQVATFTFDYCEIVSCPSTPRQCYWYNSPTSTTDFYICVTDNYWASSCGYWGAVGWNTGRDWGLKPKSAQRIVDRYGFSLLDRLKLRKTGTCQMYGSTGSNMKLTMTIVNPSVTDAGTYILGTWVWGGGGGHMGKFELKDMYKPPKQKVQTSVVKLFPPHMHTLDNMVAIADPTFQDVVAVETGYSDTNVWLEWMKYNADKHNKTNCYVCSHARPHLGTVPLQIPVDKEGFFLSLFTNVHRSYDEACKKWKDEYLIVSQSVERTESITIYPGNYTCYHNGEGGGKSLGKFPEGLCQQYSKIPGRYVQNQVNSLGDIYWICGDMRIRTRLEGGWTGECTLAKAIMPLHILEHGILREESQISDNILQRRRRSTPAGSFDPHVYIDAIGVPRGFPNEFKARDQVRAGFESLIPMITVNKSVDWINYIKMNVEWWAL